MDVRFLFYFFWDIFLSHTWNLQILKESSLISYDWSYVVAWVGVGWSLISAILFSAAAICLKGERIRDEAMNMQYLMPGTYVTLLLLLTYILVDGCYYLTIVGSKIKLDLDFRAVFHKTNFTFFYGDIKVKRNKFKVGEKKL